MGADQSTDNRRQLAESWSAFQRGETNLAEGILREILASSPQDSGAFIALGMMAATAGDPISAIGHMRAALRREPRSQPAIEWLASLYLETKDFEKAEKYALRGLLAQPRSLGCFKVVGKCALAKGEFDRAAESFQAAAQLQPSDAEAHLENGIALRKLHRQIEALSALQQAVRLNPQAEALVELADLQVQLGLAAEATDTASRALELLPDSFRAHLAMARGLANQGRDAEAEPHWSQAEALETAAGAARVQKSECYALAGRFEEAREEVRNAIALNPELGRAYYVYFASKLMTTDDEPLLRKVEEILRSANVAEDERVHLLFALGKAYDDLGEYERAIRFLDEGNELQRRLEFGNRPFDRQEFRHRIDQQIQVFTKDALSAEGDEAGELPLFVAGMMRSGTTLIDQILSCHPQVGSAGEQGIWGQERGTVVDYGRRQVDVRAAARVRRKYLELLSSMAPGCRFVIDKDPANVISLGLIHALFPGSNIICTKRHAVDTAISIWMTHTRTAAPFAYDRAAIVFAYKECLRLMEHWRAAMPESRYMEVQYEQLVEDPEGRTREMLNFCDLDWNEACLHPELNNRSIRTPSFWQVRQPVYKSSMDRWKRYQRWLGPFEELVGL